MVILVNQISCLVCFTETLLNFYGVLHGKIQGCNLFESLITGADLRFFRNTMDPELYSNTLFQALEYIDRLSLAFIVFFMPLMVSMFVFYKIQIAEFKKRIDTGIKLANKF